MDYKTHFRESMAEAIQRYRFNEVDEAIITIIQKPRLTFGTPVDEIALQEGCFDRAIAATISAIEIYNKPDFLITREEAFAVLAINGWELLLKAGIVSRSSTTTRFAGSTCWSLNQNRRHQEPSESMKLNRWIWQSIYTQS